MDGLIFILSFESAFILLLMWDDQCSKCLHGEFQMLTLGAADDFKSKLRHQMLQAKSHFSRNLSYWSCQNQFQGMKWPWTTNVLDGEDPVVWKWSIATSVMRMTGRFGLSFHSHFPHFDSVFVDRMLVNGLSLTSFLYWFILYFFNDYKMEKNKCSHFLKC